MLNETDVQKHLVEFYRKRTGIAPVISEVRYLPGGWETDVYAFNTQSLADAVHGALVLRLFPGNDGPEKSWREFGGMQRLFSAGYPVPQVFDHCPREESPFELPFFTMERIAGESLGEHLESAAPDRHSVLMRRFVEQFAALHALDWRSHFPDVTAPDLPFGAIDRYLAEIRAGIEQFQLQDAQPLLDWFEAGREKAGCSRFSVTHNDFHPWNVLVGADDKLTVIDWANIVISDPRLDLAWTLVLLRAHVGQNVAEETERLYREVSAMPVEALDYFLALQALRRLGSVVVSIMVGAEQMGMRPGAEDMMRRQLPEMRVVYELLCNLTGLRAASIESVLAG